MKIIFEAFNFQGDHIAKTERRKPTYDHDYYKKQHSFLKSY